MLSVRKALFLWMLSLYIFFFLYVFYVTIVSPSTISCKLLTETDCLHTVSCEWCVGSCVDAGSCYDKSLTLSRNSGGPSEESEQPKRSLNASLKPPFRIVQLGQARTGSTFQFELLKSITRLKTPDNVQLEFALPGPKYPETKILEKIASNTSFVWKTQRYLTPFLMDLFDEGEIAIFTTGNRAVSDYTFYNQEYDKLKACSSCEIDAYRDIFGLTDDEIDLLKFHLGNFEKLRQCCGLQMSQYRRYFLHGCNITSYPDCEHYNLTEVEQQFSASPISTTDNNALLYNWKSPGDCEYFDLLIKLGRDMNGQHFQGCQKYGYVPVENNFNSTLFQEHINNEILEQEPWLSDYIDFHRSLSKGNLERKFVYSCRTEDSCGSVGQQLVNIVSAFYIALSSGLALSIEARFPSPLVDLLIPNHILWNSSITQPQRENGTFTRTNISLGSIWESQSMKMHFQKKGWEWSSISEEKLFYLAFWTMFQFKGEVLSQVEMMKIETGLVQKMYSLDPSQVHDKQIPYIGMHYEGNAIDITSLLDCYHNCQQNSDVYLKGYLSSDILDAKYQFAKEDESVVYSTAPNDRKGNRYMNYHMTLNTLAELIILMDSSYLITTGSAMSFAASALRIGFNATNCSVDVKICNTHF